jgi:hypothetical protein
MKIKHNKKRNTAFVYEALLREATVASMRGDTKTGDIAVSLIKKHFKNGSLLKRDLDCYQSLAENHVATEKISEKIIIEAKMAQRLIDPSALFKKQTELIDDVNKELSPSIFNNYVPNYKNLATISQIFSGKLSPKKTIVLETQVIEMMCSGPTKVGPAPTVDNMVLNAFVDKFNNKYNEDLLDEQKELLSHYIASFLDNSVELKMFLNEEIGRLKAKMSEAVEKSEFTEDEAMATKASQIVEKLNVFSMSTIDESVLLTVMKTQKLVREIYDNADSN